MDQSNLRVLIVTPLGQGGAGGIDRVVDQLRVEAANNRDTELDFVVSRGPSVVGSLWNVPIAALKIAWLGLTRQIDAVHLNLSSNASTVRKVMLSWVCRVFHVPYVIHLHGAAFHTFWSELSPPADAVVDSFFACAGAVIVLGAVWRDVVLQHVPQIADRIFIVPNATQGRPQAVGSADAPNILFLGRLGERKGVPELVRALGALPRDGKWTATLAGDGAIDETRSEVQRLGLTDRVSVPGWVNATDVETLIAAADILVLPSHDENLPMSVIEGMAAGLAVVATPVGATADVIKHGVTGMLVPPGDAETLAGTLEQLIGDRPMRQRLGAAAREFHGRELDARNYIRRLSVPWAFAKGPGNAQPQPVPPSA